MMHYVYIMNTRAKILHVGMCKDILKCLDFYNSMPKLSIENDYKNFKLIYLEQHKTENIAKENFERYSRTSKKELIPIVKAANPDLIELIPNVNIEL